MFIRVLLILLLIPSLSYGEIVLQSANRVKSIHPYRYDQGMFMPASTTITYTLNVPFTSAGIGSNSYDFNGTTQYVSVADNDAFSPAAMSVCAWVNPDSIASIRDIISKDTGANREWDLKILSTGFPQFTLIEDDGGVSTLSLAGTNSVGTGKWVFICGSTTDTSATAAIGNLSVYQNCASVGVTNNSTGVWGGMVNQASDVNIGIQQGASFMDGKIMNAMFFNTAISTAVCEDAMKASSYATYAGSKTNLVAWWDLQADVEDKHSTYEGTAQGGVAPASPTAYPFKDASNPVLLANGQVLDQSPDMWGVTKGSLTVVDTSTGTVSEAGTTLSLTGATNYTTTGAYYSHTKATGTTILGTVSHANTTSMFSSHSSATLSATPIYGLAFATTNLQSGATAGGALQAIGTVSTTPVSYQFAIVGGGFDSAGIPTITGDVSADNDYGARLFIKGGTEYTNWTHVWHIMGDTTATMYATIQQNGATADVFDNIKIPTTPISSAIFQPYALDTFTGSNGDLLTAHTMDVGAGWTKRVADSVFDIDTNTAELETDGSDPLILPVTGRYVYIPTVADGITSLTVKCDATLNAKNGLMFRGKAEGATGMNAHVYELRGDGTNCDEYEILYNDDGGTALYSNAAGTLVNGTSYALTVQHIGNTIRTYRAGVKIGSDITSAVHNDGTWAGIYTDTTSNTNTAFDTFSVHGATTNGSGTSYNSFFTPYGY